MNDHEDNIMIMMERAKELFFKYSGNRFYMSLNGEEHEYDGYQISEETEEEWRKEYLDRFSGQKPHGKDALKAYATAVNFLKSSRSDKGCEEYLYYPLRSEWLDDVTVLFMLPISYELAEKWMKKRKLSKEDVKDYLNVFDAFVQKAQKRSENNTLTRDKDYTLQEFSDPVYLASYTEDLKQRWKKLI